MGTDRRKSMPEERRKKSWFQILSGSERKEARELFVIKEIVEAFCGQSVLDCKEQIGERFFTYEGREEG